MNMDNNKDFLYQRLIRLGDLMGDGLHLESDGKWIEQEYKDTLRLLGLSSKKFAYRDTKSINDFMEKRLQEVKCECGGQLFQSRKGSFVAICNRCHKKYKLGARKR